MCVGLSRPRVKAAPRSRETHPQITRKPGRCHPGRGSAWGSHKDLATAGVRDKHAARDFGSNGFNRCYSVSSPGSSFIVGNTYAAAAADLHLPRRLSRHKAEAEAETEQRMEPPLTSTHATATIMMKTGMLVPGGRHGLKSTGKITTVISLPILTTVGKGRRGNASKVTN